MPEKECLKSENCVYFYLTTAKQAQKANKRSGFEDLLAQSTLEQAKTSPKG